MADKITFLDWSIIEEFLAEAIPWGLADVGETVAVFIMITLIDAVRNHRGRESLFDWFTYFRAYKWGLIGAIFFTILRTHYQLMKKAKNRISELEDSVSETPLQNFQRYINRKIDESNVIIENVSVENLKEKATQVWHWEEGLSKAIMSALGREEWQNLMGINPTTLSRTNNWTDVEGHWIWYRSMAEGENHVNVFKTEVSKINSYLKCLLERTITNNFIETFNPGDLRIF